LGREGEKGKGRGPEKKKGEDEPSLLHSHRRGKEKKKKIDRMSLCRGREKKGGGRRKGGLFFLTVIFGNGEGGVEGASKGERPSICARPVKKERGRGRRLSLRSRMRGGKKEGGKVFIPKRGKDGQPLHCHCKIRRKRGEE